MVKCSRVMSPTSTVSASTRAAMRSPPALMMPLSVYLLLSACLTLCHIVCQCLRRPASESIVFSDVTLCLIILCKWKEKMTGSSFDLAWLSCLPSTSVSLVYLVLYVENFFITSFSLPFSVLSLWD